MKIHELKTDRRPFTAVWRRLKRFEIRKNDRGFKQFDYLILRETVYTGEEMAICGRPLEYTGRTIKVEVAYILHGPVYGLADGWCIMSIRIPKGARQPEVK